MNPVEAYDTVVQIASGDRDPRAAWGEFVALVVGEVGERLGDPLEKVDITADIAHVREQLVNLFESEPPPDDIDALYFGLFDAVDADDTETIGYYVSGVQGFDPEVGDSLCNPVWWPEGRYLESSGLGAVKSAELEAAGTDRGTEQQFLGYAGQLGAALIVTRFAVSGLERGCRVVVGFDSGDYAEVGRAAGTASSG